MFFVEPPPSQYDMHFNVAGVPVRVHPMFWLVTLVLAASVNPQPIGVLLWIMAEFICILIHELGHVMAFRYYGIDSHVVLYGFGGLAVPSSRASNLGGYGRARRDWVASCVISTAGPLAGFAFATVILLGLAAGGHRPVVLFEPSMLFLGVTWRPLPSEHVDLLLRYMQMINIWWGLMNLLPIFPLDGGQVSRAIFERFEGTDGLRRSLWLSVYVAAAVAVFAVLKWESFYTAFMFGWLAYQSYQILQQMSGGGYGGRW